MKLLGTYSSSIPDWYYQELLGLVNKSITNGGFAGGFTYDQTAITDLKNQSQTFEALALPEAGLRAVDEDFNHPISLLNARFTATKTEIANLTESVSNYISLLNKETMLLDQTVYRSILNNWVSSLPVMIGSTSFSWNFGCGIGKLANNITSDYQGFTYPFTLNQNKFYYVASNTFHKGLVANSSITKYKPKQVDWVYESQGLDDLQTGPDWAELDFLEPNILLNYLDPQVNVLLPNNSVTSPVTVTGQSTTFGIPITIKTFFKPRHSSVTLKTPSSVISSNAQFKINPGDIVHISANIVNTLLGGSATLFIQYYDANGALIPNLLTVVGSVTEAGVITNTITASTNANVAKGQLLLQSNVGSYALEALVNVNTPIRLVNGYTIDPTSASVYSATTYYSLYTDFQADRSGNITLINIPDNTDVTISYNENYPAYQCSIGGTNWSRVIMFDYFRPYPDDEKSFTQIPIGVDSDGFRTKLPILDELDNQTGLYIALTGTMSTEYLLNVYQDPDPSSCGKSAKLVVSFPQTTYLNQLTLSPYTNYPVYIESITSVGFIESDVTTIFTGKVLLDEKITLLFPTVLANTITITLLQQNYSIKQHQIQPSDYIRREAINNLQAVVPNSGRNTYVLPQVVFVNGYQYEFGVEEISAGYSTTTETAVTTSGPFILNYKPEIATFFSQSVNDGSVNSYLLYEAYDANGVLLDSNYTTNILLTSGSSIIIPFASGIAANVATVKFYVKHVLTSNTSSLDAFSLQVK